MDRALTKRELKWAAKLRANAPKILGRRRSMVWLLGTPGFLALLLLGYVVFIAENTPPGAINQGCLTLGLIVMFYGQTELIVLVTKLALALEKKEECIAAAKVSGDGEAKNASAPTDECRTN